MVDKNSSAAYINIGHEIKNQLKLFVGERSKTTFDSGCKMFDIILHEPYQFDTITFQNFYTGYLSIKAKEKSLNSKYEWVILLKRYRLMENVHGETGANKIFTLRREDMLNENLKDISKLRFILQQPSTNWKDFGIDDIQIKLANPNLSLDKILEDYAKKCEKSRKYTLDKIPTVENISTRLQNLWSLCEDASKQTSNSLEDYTRFDVDGCYEVNILSYNPN